MKLLRWQYYNFIIVVSQPPAQYMSFAKNMFKADGHEACEAFIIFIITCSKGHEPVIKHCYREAAVPRQLQPPQQESSSRSLIDMNTETSVKCKGKKRERLFY